MPRTESSTEWARLARAFASTARGCVDRPIAVGGSCQHKGAHSRHQRRQDAADVLVAHGGENERCGGPKGHDAERLCAVSIVGGVDKQRSSMARLMRSSRPGQQTDASLGDGALRHVEDASRQGVPTCAQRPQRCDLMAARQLQLEQAVVGPRRAQSNRSPPPKGTAIASTATPSTRPD